MEIITNLKKNIRIKNDEFVIIVLGKIINIYLSIYAACMHSSSSSYYYYKNKK